MAGTGFFDPGFIPTDKQVLSVGEYDPKSIQQMSPEELDRYLKLQRDDPANGLGGKGWSDTKAYNELEPALAIKYADDPYRAQRIEGGLQTEQQIATNGWNGAVDSNQYQLGGDPAFAANERDRLLFKGDAAGLRTGPVVDTSTVTPWQGGAYTAGLGQVAAGAKQGGAGDLLYGTAQAGGAGTGLAGDAGKSLLALGKMPAGPSVAELAMKAQGDTSLRQQSAIAAGARGGNAALALQNAAANQGQIQGDTQRNLGVQRASEDMANRTFAANALTGSANIFSGQDAQKIAAAQAAGSTYGGAGSTFGGAGNTFGAEANINSNIAQANATNEGAQRGRNDTREAQYDQYGNAITAAQTDLNVEGDKARVDAYTRSRNNYNQPTTPGSSTFEKIAGGALAVGGVAAAPFTGGASLAAVPAGVAVATKKPGYVSDIRAKKDVKPADKEITDAFRKAGDMGASKIRDPKVDYVAPAIYPAAAVPPTDPLFGSVMSSSEYDSYGRKAPPTPESMPAPVTRRAAREDTVGAGYVPNWVNDPTPIAPYVPDYKRRPSYDQLSPDIAMYSTPRVDPGMSRDNPFVSDIRAKKDIAPAGGRISDAFRDAAKAGSTLGSTQVEYPEELRGYNPPATPEQLAMFDEIDRQAAIRRRPQPTDLFYDPSGEGTFRNPIEQIRHNRELAGTGAGYPQTPGYQYKYKDPSSPGARPGEQYGVMAQDLEKTPAGRTVVGEKNGRKFVDPGRLSLMTAAEVAKQRRELDLLMGSRAPQ